MSRTFFFICMHKNRRLLRKWKGGKFTDDVVGPQGPNGSQDNDFHVYSLVTWLKTVYLLDRCFALFCDYEF